MRQLILIGLALLVVTTAGAQNERKYVRQGNRFYLEGVKDTTRLDTITFSKAETAYRKALDKKPNDPKWNFNLNNAVYKQTKFSFRLQFFFYSCIDHKLPSF